PDCVVAPPIPLRASCNAGSLVHALWPTTSASTDVVVPLGLRPAIAYTLSPPPAAPRCSRGVLSVGPSDQPVPGVNTSVLGSTAPVWSTPPTATSLPAAAAVASAPRRVPMDGSCFHVASPEPKLQTSLVGLLRLPMYPPTRYRRSPSTARDVWS